MTVRVLIADSAPGGVQQVRQALSHRSQVECLVADTLSPALMQESFGLAVVNFDQVPSQQQPHLAALLAQGAQRPVLLTSACSDRAALAALFGAHQLVHLLGSTDGLHAGDLRATLDKLLGDDVFGVDPWFADVAPPRNLDLTLRQSRDRHDAFVRIAAFAEEGGVGARFVERLVSAADELITNAIYDAPVDAQRRPRFAHLSRSEEFELAPDEVIQVRVCCCPERVGISVRDPFGSLAPATALRHLARGLRGGDDQIEDKPGGAGIGLFACLDAVSHLVISVAEGRATEMIALIHLTHSFREFARRAKSFNLFVAP